MKQIFVVFSVSTTVVFSSTMTRLTTTQNPTSAPIHSDSSHSTPITALLELL